MSQSVGEAKLKKIQTLSTICPNPACSHPSNHTHFLVTTFAVLISLQAQCTYHPTCGYQKQPYSAASADKPPPTQLAKDKKCVVTKYSLA